MTMIIDLLSHNMNHEKDIFGNPLVFHFKTDSPHLTVEYEVTDTASGNFPHIGRMAREQIQILYKKDGLWNSFDDISDASTLVYDLKEIIGKNRTYELYIYGPLLGNMSKLCVCVDDESNLELIDNRDKLLVCGGIHSLGVGCNTVSSMFSTIIARKLDLNPSYFVFYNRNFLDQIVKRLDKIEDFPHFEYALLELDYAFQDDVFVERHLRNVVLFFMEHVDNLVCWYTLPYKQDKKKNTIFTTLEPFMNGENFIIEEVSEVYDKEFLDICTYSNNFINDSGNIMIYKKIMKDLGAF